MYFQQLNPPWCPCSPDHTMTGGFRRIQKDSGFWTSSLPAEASLPTHPRNPLPVSGCCQPIRAHPSCQLRTTTSHFIDEDEVGFHGNRWPSCFRPVKITSWNMLTSFLLLATPVIQLTNTVASGGPSGPTWCWTSYSFTSASWTCVRVSSASWTFVHVSSASLF